ncbi:MAG: TolC family protein [Xenococcaceae cyanobacterium]
MDKSKSLLKVVGTGVCILLSWETVAVAEHLPKPLNYYRSKDFLLTELHSISPNINLSKRGYSQIPIEISQSVKLAQQTESTETEYLVPNVNPLTFPTQPEEVEIDFNEEITLQQAIELAIQNNRDLQEARQNLERAELQLREARADLYPTLDTQLQLNNQDTNRIERNADGIIERDEQQEAETSEGLATSASGNIAINYEIYSGGRVSANIRRAEKALRISELDVERLTEQTSFEATRDYYELQDTIAQVENAQATIEDATQTLRDAQLREQAGLGTRFDVLTAEVELANAQQTLNTAIANRKIAQRTLAETLSVGQQVELLPADEIEEAGVWSLSLAETIVLAYQNRAELEQELLSRELNEQQRKIALAAIRPRVNLFADYTYTVNDIFEEFEDFEERDNNTYRFGATLNWTLFDGGAAKARAEQAKIDSEIDETQFSSQRNQIRLQVEDAFFRLEANQENIGTAQKAVELAEENLRLARLRFQAGVGTQNEVIDAQAQLTDARSNFLTAVVDYNQSLNQLQRAVTNLPDGRLFDLP